MWKNSLTENPSKFNLEPSWNNFKWVLFMNYRTLYATVVFKGILTDVE